MIWIPDGGKAWDPINKKPVPALVETGTDFLIGRPPFIAGLIFWLHLDNFGVSINPVIKYISGFVNINIFFDRL